MQRLTERHHWTDARRPYRGYGYFPLRFGGHVVRRMGTQQQSVTNLNKNKNKEIPLIHCFNFSIFIQWAASIKLLIMFALLKILLVLKIYFILSFWDGIYFIISVLT